MIPFPIRTDCLSFRIFIYLSQLSQTISKKYILKIGIDLASVFRYDIIMSTKKSNLLTNLKKATIEMLLLKLLSEGDMYGYQLSQELKKRSAGSYTVLEGSMYPILYRLSDLNYISFYETKVGKRQTRVYYHLEETGRQYFRDMTQSYQNYLDIISFLLGSAEGDVYADTPEENETLLSAGYAKK